jgi:hypothetical protein
MYTNEYRHQVALLLLIEVAVVVRTIDVIERVGVVLATNSST